MVSLGASYAVAVAATLAAHYVAGPFTLGIALPIYVVAAVVPWWLASMRSGAGRAATPGRPYANADHGATPRGWAFGLLAVLLLAGGLFFFGLGQSEFQGDETMNLFDAGSALRGDDTALFFHRKGPAEIALPMALWGLSDGVTETSARLPFAWAGLLSVAGLYLLGRRLGGHRAGLIAAALLALNGFVIGFSRIVQYQSVVLMAGVLAVWCFVVFWAEDRPRLQVLGALFLALGLLAHYDGIFAVPPVLYLYAAYLRRTRSPLRRAGPAFAAGLAVGLGSLALFYWPFWRSGALAQTSEYLAFRSGGRPLYDNLALGWWTGTTYNSTYYVIFLAVAALALWVTRARSTGARIAAGVSLAGMAAVAAFPGAWTWGGFNLAFAPFLLAAVVAFVTLRREASLNLALVWLAVPFLVYDFFGIKKPGTHFWTLFVGLILLASFGLVRLWRRAPRRWAVPSAVAAVALLGPLFGYYVGIVFLRAEPDYRAGFPATKPALYWTTHAELPPQDYFGFPHKAGWAAIGALYAQGVLQGEYDSNEGGEITTWYVPDGPRYACKPMPKYYFRAERVMDETASSTTAAALKDFDEVALLTIDGRPGIRIYQRRGTGPAPQFTTQSESAPIIAAEDWTRHVAAREPWNHLTQMEHFVQTPLSATFGGQAELLGYDLDATQARAGGRLVLTLYWRRVGPPIPESYKVFVHLESDRLWAGADDVPGCGIWPTTTWRTAEVIADRHVLDLPADLPPGDVPLSIGLYRPDTGERLEVHDVAGQPQGNALVLTAVRVQ